MSDSPEDPLADTFSFAHDQAREQAKQKAEADLRREERARRGRRVLRWVMVLSIPVAVGLL